MQSSPVPAESIDTGHALSTLKLQEFPGLIHEHVSLNDFVNSSGYQGTNCKDHHHLEREDADAKLDQTAPMQNFCYSLSFWAEIVWLAHQRTIDP